MSARQYKSTTEVQQLDATINDAVGQIVLTNNSTFHPATLPSPPYTLVIDPDTSKEEIVTVTSKVSDSVLNVTRHEDGTGAIGHSAGAVVKHMVTARDLQEPQNHIYASTNVHDIGSGVAVVGDTKSQILTNKTMTGTANTFSAIPQSAITSLETDLNLKAPLANPTFTGTVVLSSTTSIGTVSSTELGYVDGVTSSIQTQLNTNTPVGSITMWAKAEVPNGWLECNGQSTTGYTALAGVVGATVPDMRGLVPVGFKTDDDAFGTLKGTGGSKISTAVHTHSLSAHTHGLGGHTHGDDHVHSGSTGGGGTHQHTINTAIEITGAIANGDGSRWLVDAKNTELNYLTTAANGDHSHGFTTNAKSTQGYGTTTSGPSGGSDGPSTDVSGASSQGATNGNLQPYFTIKFIIKY